MTDLAAPPQRWTALFAAAALAVCAAAFGWRQIESPDLGYHLAYGELCVRDLAPVDSDVGLWPLDAPGSDDDLGPGCWRDAAGHHRFPNANWLSQLCLWGAWCVGGATALTMLVVVLAAGITLVLFHGLRRCGVAVGAAAATALFVLLVLSFRLEPRPELFGGLVLAWQCVVLLRALADGMPSRRTCVGLLAAQLLFVNLHGYFVLGVAATACCWLQALMTMPGARRRWSALLGAQALVCLVNPWTWRLLLLPFTTVLYLQRHHVTATDRKPPHPWSAIDEFHPLPLPWAAGALDLVLVLFYLLLLAALAALVLALVRRRVAHAGLLLLAVLQALAMKRNVPASALLAMPTAAVTAGRALAHAGARTAMAVAAVALLIAALVAGGVWYPLIGMRAQSGSGLSPLWLPTGVARWLDAHPQPGRLFTDFNASSNLHFFTAARPEVPILTNTWAYPPAVFARLLGLLTAAPFQPAPDVTTVAVETDTTAAPLVKRLAQDRDWSLAHLEPRYAVFVRDHAADSAREDAFDVAAWRAPFVASPVLDRRALLSTARTFELVGWQQAAIPVQQALLQLLPRDGAMWNRLGALLIRRGLGPRPSPGDLEAARDALAKALDLEPGLTGARDNLQVVQRALAARR